MKQPIDPTRAITPDLAYTSVKLALSKLEPLGSEEIDVELARVLLFLRLWPYLLRRYHRNRQRRLQGA